MASKKELAARWTREPGRTILERVHAFLHETQSPGHGRSSNDLFALLDGLPFREEIANGRDLRGAALGGGARELDLAGCDFGYAKLTLNLAHCDMVGARFDDVAGGNGIMTGRLDHASFVRARLRATFFQGAQARHACFDGALLTGSSFENADLAGSSFRDADCRRVKFLGANLVGCDLRGARLDEAVIQEVQLDETTDLRGASLVNVYDREVRDRAGNLVARGTDWRRARIDDSTSQAADSGAAARELIDVALPLAEASGRPWARAVADALRSARGSAGDDNVWYDDVLAAAGPEARAEVDALFSAAMRRLL